MPLLHTQANVHTLNVLSGLQLGSQMCHHLDVMQPELYLNRIHGKTNISDVSSSNIFITSDT